MFVYCMYRLGFTESTLLFFFYLDNYCKNANKQLYKAQQLKLLKWLYTTSGFYDKTININTASLNEIISSQTYTNYFNLLINSIKAYKKQIILNFHKIKEELSKNYMDLFYLFIKKPNSKPTHPVDSKYVFEFIKNKKVVIINNLGILMKQQYYNGNLQKIYSDFPVVRDLNFINTGYTFLNNGPYKSILESVKHIYAKIDLIAPNTDSFIISNGAYSVLIANYITQKYNKDVLIIGGNLPLYFGVKTQRSLANNSRLLNEKKEFFVSVPQSMKPTNYQLIENGCYW